ncbi:hypothetical protein [Pedobacter sp. GR22-10]|uniref:hypothetical protein n=1 Tax=Pedobacter sp. GR22-10 TaxID=2994472 RepID=UPI0022468D7B|nr:hypothetical protein [Pedobacter sp. GR22-10]MCX2431101.1 hypothetical protein [Pedobacter sp. GR22-10]
MDNSFKTKERFWSYREQVDLNKLFNTGPIVKTLMANCSIDQEQINLAWEQHHNGITLKKTLITLNPPIIGNNKLYELLRKNYNVLLNNQKYAKLCVLDIEEELFVLMIMAYEYYWIRDGLVLRSYVERDSLISDYSTFNSHINDTHEIADAISIILAIDEALYLDRHININGKFKINNEAVLIDLKTSLDKWLSEIEPFKLQSSINLIQLYEAYKISDNGADVLEEIKFLKGIENKDLEYMLNDSIANISLIVREFLINNGILPKTKLTPKIFLQLMTDLFEVFNIKTIPMENSTDKTEVIRLAIRYYLKKLNKSGK